MNKRTIAIIGACCSRDAFNKKFIPDWNSYFSVVITRFTSFISLMSTPVPISRALKRYNNDKRFWHNTFYDECEKNLLNGLVSVNPEFIVIDFYNDAVKGMINLGTNHYLTDHTSGHWEDLIALKAFEKTEKCSVFNDPSFYFELWKDSFDYFMEFILL